jgi:putative hydrolase of the HAD superfamily
LPQRWVRLQAPLNAISTEWFLNNGDLMIKAIFFDFDGVLTLDKTGSYTICKYISKKTGIDFEKLSQSYKKFNNDLLYGKTTHEKIWPNLCLELNSELDIKHLFDSFINTPINFSIYNLIKKLKISYKTGLITDNKKDRMIAIIEKQNLNKIFNTIIVSADIGSGKDNDDIFNKAIDSLDVKHEECIFIDNQEKNLLIPKKLGMNVIFYNHEKNDVNELISKLIEVENKI